MDESLVKTNSWWAWLLAARPKTLAGAAVPVMIGAVLAAVDSDGRMAWLPCVLCFLFAFIMQIDANFVNDYFDFQRGNDDAETRLGPKRACSMGWITPRAMQWGLLFTTALACVVGLPLAFIGGWPMVVVGAVCVLFCFLYTTRLSYLGLGDVLVLVFFGIVPVCLTYYLSLPAEARTVTWEVFVVSLACGLVIDTLLLVNNYRDIDNDRRDGKRTLIVRVGPVWGRRLYLWAGVLAVGLSFVFFFSEHYLPVALLVTHYLSMHVATYRHMKRIGGGKELNRVLGETARNMFFFGVDTVVGMGYYLMA
ncbi:MAG: 1,4-dihydroxy-2-naphthoate octaprenyltransferase [Prevotella sp.]|nr:1,4-dihydroxy-2-naphthoate octaprenyltransferase [Prevotella sp.]